MAAVVGAPASAAAAAVETASMPLASMLLFRDETGVEFEVINVVVPGEPVAQSEQISICGVGVRQ
jgi:hypothetical protein